MSTSRVADEIAVRRYTLHARIVRACDPMCRWLSAYSSLRLRLNHLESFCTIKNITKESTEVLSPICSAIASSDICEQHLYLLAAAARSKQSGALSLKLRFRLAEHNTARVIRVRKAGRGTANRLRLAALRIAFLWALGYTVHLLTCAGFAVC